ncbi:hypothetical protein BDZ89DRAFT_1072158 [Hymenopellis radicata]|nr:hypothetical protein BDZ89DRAFT_1072158 [Hymenopellis radicata]
MTDAGVSGWKQDDDGGRIGRKYAHAKSWSPTDGAMPPSFALGESQMRYIPSPPGKARPGIAVNNGTVLMLTVDGNAACYRNYAPLVESLTTTINGRKRMSFSPG